ncbi:unnamed protein product, partial [Symbiodinium pilosum]
MAPKWQTQWDQQWQEQQWQGPQSEIQGSQGADKAQDRRHELYRAKLDIKRLEDRLEEVNQEQIDALKAQHKTAEDGFKAEIRTLQAKLEAEEQKTKKATAADLKPWMDANDKFVKQEKEMTAKIDELRNER